MHKELSDCPNENSLNSDYLHTLTWIEINVKLSDFRLPAYRLSEYRLLACKLSEYRLSACRLSEYRLCIPFIWIQIVQTLIFCVQTVRMYGIQIKCLNVDGLNSDYLHDDNQNYIDCSNTDCVGIQIVWM